VDGEALMLGWVWKLGKWAAGAITGGSLDRILDTIEKRMDDETRKEEIKAKVTETWINAQANLLVGRTWWFQLFFVLPMAVHWAAINWVSTFPQYGWVVHPLPAPFDEWEGWIISALFLVDGGKAVLGRFK
jgi:hypothetical protein